MKVSCCCFTCIVGHDDENEPKEETSQLLKEEEVDELLTPHDKQPYSRSTSALSSSSTQRGLSTESSDHVSESFDSSNSHKFTKAVGILKKYNVMSSKYNTKELQRQMSSPAKLRLKVGVKIMPRSSTVKVSVIEAHDVLDILQSKGLLEMKGSTDHEPSMVVQVRTKIMHSEVRGHTRKYEIQGGLTGALKLRNETIHTVDMDEFLNCKIRFRLYYVLKKQRDKLLGEYTLDIPSLNLDTNVSVSHTMFELCDPSLVESEEALLSPTIQVTPVPQRLMSSDSQNSMEKDSQGNPKIQRQAKIRSQDSESLLVVNKSHEKISSDESHQFEKSDEETSPSKKSFSKAYKSMRHGASSMLSKESSRDKSSRSVSSEAEPTSTPSGPSTEHLTANEKLKLALRERGDKVEKVEEVTADMANTASNFTVLSLKLKEKYMTESSKKQKSHKS